MRNMLLKYWPILLILALSALVVWPLFLPGYFSHHDDLQVMRIFEMRKCIEDFQIPCRWVPDMGFGNGFPLFNYYGVFPYYIGAILSCKVFVFHCAFNGWYYYVSFGWEDRGEMGWINLWYFISFCSIQVSGCLCERRHFREFCIGHNTSSFLFWTKAC